MISKVELHNSVSSKKKKNAVMLKKMAVSIWQLQLPIRLLTSDLGKVDSVSSQSKCNKQFHQGNKVYTCLVHCTVWKAVVEESFPMK